MANGLEFSVKMSGFPELLAKLEKLGKLEDGKALRTAAKAGVKPVFTQAKINVPKSLDAARTARKGPDGKGRLVGPGFASRNIRTISQLKPSQGIARASVGVRADAYYAVQFVERGTRYQKKNPWLENASEATQDKQIEAVTESLQKSIEKASK